jgi:hypothetical protein
VNNWVGLRVANVCKRQSRISGAVSVSNIQASRPNSELCQVSAQSSCGHVNRWCLSSRSCWQQGHLLCSQYFQLSIIVPIPKKPLTCLETQRR